MSNRQGKCPGCGLVNPPDAAECRWCAFVLRAGARARPSSNAYAKPSSTEQSRRGLPFGWLIASVLLVMGLAGTWHSVRVNAEREARLAEATEKAGDDERPGKKSGPPTLSERRRRTGDGSDVRGLTAADMIRMGAERKEEFNRVIQDHERGVYGDKEARRAGEARRALSGPSPGQRQQPVFLEAQPPRDITDEP